MKTKTYGAQQEGQMCPACIAAAALLAAKVISTGGVSALLVVRKFSAKNAASAQADRRSVKI
jgi:hypothetical protein